MEFQRPGRAVILLGGLGSCEPRRFGGTQYAKVILKQLWGLPPALDMDLEKRVQAAVREIVAEGLAESSHDVGDGGLAVALAECSFGASGVSAEATLTSEMKDEYLLFHEGPSRILISTDRPEAAQAIAARHGVKAPVIGRTQAGRLAIRNGGRLLLEADAGELRGRWETALETLLRG